ncbi:Nicotinate phosphoribosyltransferase pncB2 [uncultured Defluviicoccus sp.]|uniref:nicotinate phosphoribosyltransferase n=1 Tax=metagenome TaxID=256318 RepID=A0A380TF64_9ZZZZ|nr:Nicotinate phosphoribosyltransferase pncB2 [uncultured Defluviicoccus sp.]
MDLFANPLLTDLYQLNMMQSYLEHGMTGTAVFEFFCRKLPPRRNFLMAAGLAQAVEFLETVRFSAADLDWLRGTGRFSADFLRYLEGFRFTGDADAMAEGTVFFPDEPLLRIIAPLPQAQFMETRLINLMQLQTVVASKAARMVLAAPRRTLIDFGLRRAHGAEAGLLAARAAYIAGFAGTATVLAGRMFGIPIFGTMAHAFIQAHDDEALAFERFARSRPDNLVLLIDTYDTEAGARKVVALAPRLKAAGIVLRGVRLDSGDLASHARAVRAILDAGGLAEVKIFASGGLDEDRLATFTANAVPIDGFGIGTSLVTSEDAPALDCAYKLQEYAGIPRRKRSEGKATWPGRKQVFRRYADDGTLVSDILTAEGDVQTGEPLLAPVVRAGCRVAPLPTLDAIRAHAAAQLDRLPPALRRLGGGATCPVQVAPALRALADAADRHTGIGTAGPA